MKRTPVAAMAFCLATMVALGGCGKAAPTAAETAPFEAAIGACLKARSMDMKVAEVKSLEVAGDTATAACAMEEATGLYGGVKVKWTFTFARDGDGAWKVAKLDKP